jgi:GNAT superfamily N-acetyltransferase
VFGYVMAVAPSNDRNECVISTAGRCMRPWLWPGGRIRVRRCQAADIEVGDIAVWFDGQRLVSHRVVALKGDRFVTRGDTAHEPDAPAASDQLLGRVTAFSILGASWPLDGAAGRFFGRVMVSMPWLMPLRWRFARAWRTRLGLVVERLYCAAPTRQLRRWLPAKASCIEDLSQGAWPLQLRVRRGALEVARLEMSEDGEVTDLWVRNLWRGIGLGRALVERAVGEARRCRLERVTVAPPRPDERVRALLTSAGFWPQEGGAFVCRLG